jgi:asparagine synthase (glutamine-hydrolysing)
MCGICGHFGDLAADDPGQGTLDRMTQSLVYRGPDSKGKYVDHRAALGFRRLSLVDLQGGDQPLFNENGSIVLICNGEIYNHRELRRQLSGSHQFRTGSDTEVIVHLYEEFGYGLFEKLNGQFAFALYDRNHQSLLLARDHFGICPCFYTVVDGVLIFASEIKAILEHPLVKREINLTGLDQIFSFPGLVSPATMFKNIHSLKSGHYLIAKDRKIQIREYWDLEYPFEAEAQHVNGSDECLEELECLLADSVKLRLQADVPVGFYLSGGLDSSLIAALICKTVPGETVHAFAIDFEDRSLSEGQYQKLVAKHVNSHLHTVTFGWREISERLRDVVHHCECPIKETYNTASLALSRSAKDAGISAVLTGEGADELFAGYVGYRFDHFRRHATVRPSSDQALEDEIRERLWGDSRLFYEQDYGALSRLKKTLYSEQVRNEFPEFDCLKFELINKDKIRGRQFLHQRSYLDFKLRLCDHLLSDHGDRMVLANSVEARYPFLDQRIVNLACRMPPHLKLNGYIEKYALRRLAEKLLPARVARREKFAFVAPGSPYLLQQNIEWVEDLLSRERIQRQGVFEADVIEQLKQRYRTPGFSLNVPFEPDLLMVVLTFSLFLEVFDMPSLN